MDRTERLLDLVALLLHAQEPVSSAELRELFPDDYGGSREAADRKLERDKEELVALGVPVAFVPASEERELGGYVIDRGAFFLRDLQLSPEETAALYAAGSAALASRDFPFAQDLAHALRKIGLAGSGPHAEAGAGGGTAARRLLIVRPGDPSRAGKIQQLLDAIARRKRVHLVYRRPPSIGEAPQPEETTARDVDPYGLACHGGAWRLVAHCHLRRAQRIFIVDRIESLEVSRAKPNQPDFEPPEGLDPGAVAGARPWQWNLGPPAEVTLRFAPGSELLAERDFDAKAGDTAVLRVTYLEGLVRHVLSFGDRLWIAAPPSARASAVAALARVAGRLEAETGPLDSTARPAGVPQPPAPDAARGESAATVGKAAPTRGLAASERLRRLLLIVPAARRRPGLRVEELAAELGLEAAELLEDIEFLALVGRPPFSPDDLIDISVERGRVHVTLDQSFSRPPQLTALEALALAAAAQETAPADPAVTSALAKLTGQLPPRARALYGTLAQRLQAAAALPPGTSGLLADLRAAADERREVQLDYDKEGRGAFEVRPLQPWAVVDHGGRWYVYGHDVTRGAPRTFRLDRLRAVRATGRSFEPPPAAEVDRRAREALFSGAAEVPVVVRFSAGAAPWALARYGPKARALDGGGAEVTLDNAGTRWAVSFALSFAGEAEVVSPPAAREALRAEVQRALARYAEH